jgi:hypothetical protein
MHLLPSMLYYTMRWCQPTQHCDDTGFDNTSSIAGGYGSAFDHMTSSTTTSTSGSTYCSNGNGNGNGSMLSSLSNSSSSVFSYYIESLGSSIFNHNRSSYRIAATTAPLFASDFFFAMCVYVIWQVGYFLKTEVFDKHKVRGGFFFFSSAFFTFLRPVCFAF